MPTPTIAISLGDPAGIGPEVTWKALADAAVRSLANWIVVGERWIIDELTGPFGLAPTRVVSSSAEISPGVELTVFDRRRLSPAQRRIGEVSAACGVAGLDYVRVAAELCLAHQADAMVTAPLNKEAVARSGQPFCGHTEYIADLCNVHESRMLLFNEQMRVVHVSTHCSLVDATDLSKSRIVKTIELGYEALVQLGWERPTIAVCGLNPHAGENGMFGSEETEHIVPAIEAARAAGIDCTGPFPADALFVQAARGKYDLVVAMYHDQGHVAMKLLDFEHTVNVTLGLPIIRTSVDHGTAFDIAGKNVACADDMKAAMQLAVRMAGQRSSASPS